MAVIEWIRFLAGAVLLAGRATEAEEEKEKEAGDGTVF